MKDRLRHVLRTLEEMERTPRTIGPLHSIDTRAKLIVTAVFLVTMLSVPLRRLSEILLYSVFPIVTATTGGLHYGTVLKRSLAVLPFVVLVGSFNVIYDRAPVFRIGQLTVTEGWIGFLSILLRGLLSTQALLLLVQSTGYYRMCRGLHRLGVPSFFTTQLLFVFRYIRVLLEESLDMKRARDARSYGRSSYPLAVWGTLVGQLLIRTFDRAAYIHRAMLARGFTGRMPDCTLGSGSSWRPRDTVFVALWSTTFILMRLFEPAESVTRSLSEHSIF